MKKKVAVAWGCAHLGRRQWKAFARDCTHSFNDWIYTVSHPRNDSPRYAAEKLFINIMVARVNETTTVVEGLINPIRLVLVQPFVVGEA